MSLEPTSQDGPIAAYWSEPLDNLFTKLHSLDRGLSTAQAEETLDKIGLNRIYEKAKQLAELAKSWFYRRFGAAQ